MDWNEELLEDYTKSLQLLEQRAAEMKAAIPAIANRKTRLGELRRYYHLMHVISEKQMDIAVLKHYYKDSMPEDPYNKYVLIDSAYLDNTE